MHKLLGGESNFIYNYNTCFFNHPAPSWCCWSNLRIVDEFYRCHSNLTIVQKLHPWKLTWHWKIPIFNRKYIFKWSIFLCHVSFRGVFKFFEELQGGPAMSFTPDNLGARGSGSCLFWWGGKESGNIRSLKTKEWSLKIDGCWKMTTFSFKEFGSYSGSTFVHCITDFAWCMPSSSRGSKNRGRPEGCVFLIEAH